jgi:NTE family protein
MTIFHHKKGYSFPANIVRILIIILAFPCNFPSSYAQPVEKRPRVGLALSGGGSLGMAHIGVLKVMEEAGLRPDYITGVSMGSIVGGFYSIGYSPDSLEKLFRSADWNLILSNKIPENKVIFTEKKNYNNSIVSLPIASKKVRLPSGLINGQQIESMLSYYAWPAARINDFSKLPIPFLCVGTDLITCREVVLKKGYLPDAIRASMAVPSLFSPIKIDTAVIIDGGFVRNIAVSELRDMGADIVIGSYTGFHKFNENELQSVAGVLKQLSFFNSILDYASEKKLIDILIEPNTNDMSSTVFTNSDSIIQRGYKAAVPFREKFRQLADSLNRIGPQTTPPNILDEKPYAFDAIKINGNKINSDEQILGVLDIRPHQPVDKNMLTDRIELLYGRAWFEKVKYKIVPRNDSLILVIDCIEKPKAIINGSLHYDNAIRAGLLVTLSVKNLISHGSSIDINTFLGQYYRFSGSLTHFIDRNQSLGVSLNFNGDNTLIPFLTFRSEKGQFYRRFFSSVLSIDKRIGLNHFMSLSADYGNLNLVPDFISVNQLKKLSFNYLSLGYMNELNTLDNKHFPKKGVILNITVNASKLFEGYYRTPNYRYEYTESNPADFRFKRAYSFIAGWRKYFSPSRKLSFSFGGDALFTYTSDTTLSPNNYYFLGGQDYTTNRSIPLTGFHANEIPVAKAASFCINGDFEFSDNFHLGLLTNIAAAQEIGNGKNISWIGGYGLTAGYMSKIGPIRIGLMQGLSSTARYFSSIKGFISIGFSF